MAASSRPRMEGDLTVMTEERILKECKKRSGYSYPDLNEKLYLGHLGFQRIENLDSFINCTVLYLNNNSISDVSGLSSLTHLTALYLSYNILTSASLGWSSESSARPFSKLITLDMSFNSIQKIDDALHLSAPSLETLLLSHNQVKNIRGVQNFQKLTTLDVSHNHLRREEDVVPYILVLNQQLKTAIFTGNEFVGHLLNYRKKLIGKMPSLLYLDARPVFPEEREIAEVFCIGGVEAEMSVKEKQKIRDELERKDRHQFMNDTLDAVRNNPNDGVVSKPSAYLITQMSEMDDVFIPS